MASCKQLLFFFVLLSSAFVLLPPAAQAVKFSHCFKFKHYVVSVHKVEVDPEPAIAGQTAEIRIFASTEKRINGGEVRLFLNGPTSKWSRFEDLCGLTSCPIEPGRFVLTRKFNFKENSTPGKYTLYMRTFNLRSVEMNCMFMEFSLEGGSIALEDGDIDASLPSTTSKGDEDAYLQFVI